MDKPVGPTSHDIVAMARRQLQQRRVGHAGTLDPFASGLLTLLVGPATRLSRFVSDLDKAYIGTIVLGVETDTCDHTGAVVAEHDPANIGDEEIRAAAGELVGTIRQVPPSYSAKKVGGRSAHRLARGGARVDLAPVEVEVVEFDVMGRDGPHLDFRARVGSGTYLRALARDLGRRLNCGAHLSALRRMAVGGFRVEDAVDPSRVEASHVLPPAAAVSHLPRMDLSSEDDVAALRHGRPVEVATDEATWAAAFRDDALVAVGSIDTGVFQPRIVMPA